MWLMRFPLSERLAAKNDAPNVIPKTIVKNVKSDNSSIISYTGAEPNSFTKKNIIYITAIDMTHRRNSGERNPHLSTCRKRLPEKLFTGFIIFIIFYLMEKTPVNIFLWFLGSFGAMLIFLYNLKVLRKKISKAILLM